MAECGGGSLVCGKHTETSKGDEVPVPKSLAGVPKVQCTDLHLLCEHSDHSSTSEGAALLR